MNAWKTGGVLLTLALAAGRLDLSATAADIDQSTHVLFRLESPVSTKTAQVGDPVQLRTASPMTTDGRSIPVGSSARGVVTRSKRPGRVRGRGELEIGIVSITLPDGTVLPFTARSSSMETPRGRLPYPAPRLPFLAGMVAGYGTANLVARISNSGETIAKSGVVAGLATGVLVGVLKRGEDLILRPGLTIGVVLERAAPPD
jgi:type IV secretion system protein VirB10